MSLFCLGLSLWYAEEKKVHHDIDVDTIAGQFSAQVTDDMTPKDCSLSTLLPDIWVFQYAVQHFRNVLFRDIWVLYFPPMLVAFLNLARFAINREVNFSTSPLNSKGKGVNVFMPWWRLVSILRPPAARKRTSNQPNRNILF